MLDFVLEGADRLMLTGLTEGPRLIHNMMPAQHFVLFRDPASPTVVLSICERRFVLTEVADGTKRWSRIKFYFSIRALASNQSDRSLVQLICSADQHLLFVHFNTTIHYALHVIIKRRATRELCMRR